MCRFQPRDARAIEMGRKTGDRGSSVMWRQRERRVPLIDHSSNIDRRLQGNTAYLYFYDVTSFLGTGEMGRSFLGTLSLWTEDVI